MIDICASHVTAQGEQFVMQFECILRIYDEYTVFPCSMFAVRITATDTRLHYVQIQIKSLIKWPLVCLIIHLLLCMQPILFL